MIEWIRVADPAAGVADDFQFMASGRRHALQVKWSQFPGSFVWSEFVGTSGEGESLLGELAGAWKRIRAGWDGALTIHLCTNNFLSNATPQAGTALASAASPPRHFAAFYARSFSPLSDLLRMHGEYTWVDVVELDLVIEWSEVWTALVDASGLSVGEFVDFLRDFEFAFVPLDQAELVQPRESADLGHLASVLQSVVVDPARPVELSRAELMQRLGWSERVEYRNPHRFPVPETYAANGAARTALEAALDRHTSGYVALIGPAGSGKSTLVESLSIPGRLVKYYAFVPDSPDPLSGRGEAQSFLHDVSLALEEAGVYRNGFGAELLGQRQVFFDQLAQAGKRFSDEGVRTTIIVDGLDHIPREQNPTRSLLDELPPPTALPDGVCILIGSQTTSILPQVIRDGLVGAERVMEVPPLSEPEVEAIATLAGVADWLAPGQMAELVDKSEGHPLVLTYMVQDLRALEGTSEVQDRRAQADQMLRSASEYRGSIDLRYRHYLGSLLEDQEVLAVLGIVCRLRIPLDLEWLESWADSAAVSRFVERTHTFFRRAGSEWTFIHNSFRRFLVEETATVGGELRDWKSRELHETLADRCAASIGWPQYQDEELAQRFLAGQLQVVLDTAVPDKLRRSLFDGRPYGVVTDHAMVAIRAAAEARDYRALLRLLMFLNELNQRGYVLSAEEIAKAMAELDPGSAVEHTVQGRTLRIETVPALDVAAKLASANYLQDSESIVRAAGGLQGLIGERRHQQREWVESIADWAEATWRRSGAGRVLDELDHRLPFPADEVAPQSEESSTSNDEEGWKADRELREAREERASVVAARNAVHARCFDLADSIRDRETCSLLADRIDAEANVDWRARRHVIAARSAQVDGETAEVLRQVRMMLALETQQENLAEASGVTHSDDLDEDDEEVAPQAKRIVLSLRVAAADVLARAGLAESEEFVGILPPATIAAWPSSLSGSDGLAPYNTILGVLRVRSLTQWVDIYDDLPAGGLTTADADQGAGRRRFMDALTRVAQLEAQAIAFSLGAAEAPDIAALADPVIRLLDVPFQTTHDWTGWYLIVDAALDLYTRLIELAFRCGGYSQLSRLMEQFKVAWDSPERGLYWSASRRIGVIRSIAGFDEAAGWCGIELDSVESTIGQMNDPHSSASAWLDIARTRSELGDRPGAFEAVGNAHRDGWGPAQHDDDYQLVTWLAWLVDAVNLGEIDRGAFLDEARRYADRLVAATDGAEGQVSDAASNLVEAVFAYDPGLATDMGEALCGRGVFSEGEMVLAIIKGAAERPEVDPELAASLLTDLLMPLSTDTPASLEHQLAERSADAAAMIAQLENAKALWSAPDSRRSDNAVEVDAPEDAAGPEVEPLIALPTVLGQMRSNQASEAAPADVARWSRTIVAFTGVASRVVAVELLAEAQRLSLEPAITAALAGIAARAGAVDEAQAVLSRILARTEPHGWMRHWDGGSRVALFEAAIQDPGDAIVDLAARDLAGLVASRTIGGDFRPRDLRRFAELLGGSELVAQCWSDVRAYLDVFAPAADHLPELVTRESKTAQEEVLDWAGRQLGHPVRILDFGARRVLAAAHSAHPTAVEALLADVLGRGGWAAEAALHVLMEARNRGGLSHTPELDAALVGSASDKDAIVRVLARRLLALEQLEAPVIPVVSLAPFYDLDLPPLPARSIPELDRHGVPHVDTTDPQQVIGPFDHHLHAVADEAGIDLAVLVHRAAALGRAATDRWTADGHREHSDRLRSRGNLHTYRPWAYMVGRRGCARVIAELIDARALPNGARSLFLDLMIEESTNWVQPLPLDVTTPMPWRDPQNRDYPSEDWCNEASDAAEFYASEYSGNHVLAEQSNWRWLGWGVPEEERRVRTTHGERANSPLITAVSNSAWELSADVASRYPRLRDLRWDDRELVVRGRGLYSDAERLDWIALHPAVAHALDWQPGQSLFEWVGADGLWRARSVLRVRGQLSHQPPSDAVCAEVWQVVLSDPGWDELAERFPGLERRVRVRRILPASRREGRDLIEAAATALVVD